MNTYTREDYYNPNRNTADKFNNFLMSKLTNRLIANNASGDYGTNNWIPANTTQGTGIGAWSNSTVLSESSFTGMNTTTINTTIDTVNNLDNFEHVRDFNYPNLGSVSVY